MKKNPTKSTLVLLTNYCFDLNGGDLEQLVHNWLDSYPSKWVIAAIVEALYQGRYKVTSVNRILNSWSLKGQPVHHFDHDFADVVCKKLMKNSVGEYVPVNPTQVKQPTTMATKKENAATPSTQNNLQSSQGNQSLHFMNQSVIVSNTPNPGIERWAKLVTQLTA